MSAAFVRRVTASSLRCSLRAIQPDTARCCISACSAQYGFFAAIIPFAKFFNPGQVLLCARDVGCALHQCLARTIAQPQRERGLYLAMTGSLDAGASIARLPPTAGAPKQPSCCGVEPYIGS